MSARLAALPAQARAAGAPTQALKGLLSKEFLDLVAWDDAVGVLTFPPEHPLLGWAGNGRIAAASPKRAGPAIPSTGVRCAVRACHTYREGSSSYCPAHGRRWKSVSRRAQTLDEQRWRLVTPAATGEGQVSLRGLPALIVAQVLYGVQHRTATGRQTKWPYLRRLCDRLREQQVASVEELTDDHNKLRASILRSVQEAFLDPETERHKDFWDLTAFGPWNGRLRFDGISQAWLREATKRWALDDLPHRRGKRVDAQVQRRIRAIAYVSESLRLQRDDHGEDFRVLGAEDITMFCNRMALLQGRGDMTAPMRLTACRMVRVVLESLRTMGLTRSGQPLAGLSGDFTLRQSQIPEHIDDEEAGRDLPREVMQTLCASLDQLTQLCAPEIRTAIELLIDTGRRPDELCQLRWDCLEYDNGGQPVLVYDNIKSARMGCRLPIAEATASVITAQQARTAERFPQTPPGELKLLPSAKFNPSGHRGISVTTINHHHARWITQLNPIVLATETTVDGHVRTVLLPFDMSKIRLYAYRHSYAQRHADAGVAVDILRELMGHLRMDTTQRYYRVGERRRREAVDRVAVMQFDRHGNRLWRSTQRLLDDERVRLAVGEVAVPYGGCTEPTNVAAGGGACPIRFRCVGCGHFRTDASYLPDLEAYLADLLRNRERLLATAMDADDWATKEATPSEEEITRIQRLIERIRTELDDLTPTERAEIENAVAVMRRGRVTLRVSPAPQQSVRALRPPRAS